MTFKTSEDFDSACYQVIKQHRCATVHENVFTRTSHQNMMSFNTTEFPTDVCILKVNYRPKHVTKINGTVLKKNKTNGKAMFHLAVSTRWWTSSAVHDARHEWHTGERRGALRCLSDNKQGWSSGRDVLCHVSDSQRTSLVSNVTLLTVSPKREQITRVLFNVKMN